MAEQQNTTVLYNKRTNAATTITQVQVNQDQEEEEEKEEEKKNKHRHTLGTGSMMNHRD